MSKAEVLGNVLLSALSEANISWNASDFEGIWSNEDSMNSSEDQSTPTGDNHVPIDEPVRLFDSLSSPASLQASKTTETPSITSRTLKPISSKKSHLQLPRKSTSTITSLKGPTETETENPIESQSSLRYDNQVTCDTSTGKEAGQRVLIKNVKEEETENASRPSDGRTEYLKLSGETRVERKKGRRKQAAVTVVKAKDISGNRGNEDLFTLVDFIEGETRKPKTKRKGKKKTEKQKQLENPHSEKETQEDQKSINERSSANIPEPIVVENQKQVCTSKTETPIPSVIAETDDFVWEEEVREELPFEIVGRRNRRKK